MIKILHNQENQKLLEQGAKELGITLNDNQIRLFFTYIETLKSYSQKINITGIKTTQEMIIKHFLDSLTCSSGFKPSDKITAIDLGTGAGFPGIPLKICYPQINLTLLDSMEKSVAFLYRLKKDLQLEFEILSGRAENFAKKKEYREGFDLVLARAVAKLNTLVEYALPFLKIGGIFIAQKGDEIENELEQAQKAIDILGGRVRERQRIILPIVKEDKNLIIIEKIKPTPLEYPRRASVPKKKPL